MWLSCLAAVLLQGGGPPKAPEAGEQTTERKPQNVLFLEKARIEHKDGRVTIVYQIGHDPKRETEKLLTRFKSPAGWIHTSEEFHLLVISDRKENVQVMDQILRAAMSPPPQVKIEVQVIEVRWTKDQQIGLFGDLTGNFAIWQKSLPSDALIRELRMNFSPTAASGSSPFIGSSFRFFSSHDERGTVGGVLQAFLERGRAEVKSSPTVWVRTGETAQIHSGEKVPIPHSVIHPGGVNTTVKFEKTGVTLQVTPHVVARDLVGLKVEPSVTAVLGREIIASSKGENITAPTLTERNLKTDIIARSGETVLIGGLIRKESVTVRRGIPLLMDIPLLGALFSRHETQELVTEIIFLLRPTVYATLQRTPHGIIDPEHGWK